MEPLSLASRIASVAGTEGSYDTRRKKIREFLFTELQPYSEEDRKKELADITEWAFNLLRRKEQERCLSLMTFAFLIEVEGGERCLAQLPADLEKLLPTDSMQVLNGIAYLFARLHQLTPTRFLERIFNRCSGFLTNRATDAGIVTAVVLMKRLGPLASDLFQTSAKDLPTSIWIALKFTREKIQKMAVDIYTRFVSASANSEELLRGMVSMCLVLLRSYSNPLECIGPVLVLRRLLEENSEYVTERFDDVFNALVQYCLKNKNAHALRVLAMLCESDKEGAIKHIDDLVAIVDGEWPLNEVCGDLVRIAQLSRDTLGKICWKKACALLEGENKDEKIFFRLASVNYLYPLKMLESFQNCVELSMELVDSAVGFLHIFPEHKFTLLSIMTEKIDNNIDTEPAFVFIHSIDKYLSFPFQSYWEPMLPLMYQDNQNLSERARINLVKALMTIIRNDNQSQLVKLKQLLFVLHEVKNNKVIVAMLEEVADSLLCHFAEDANLMLLVTLIDRHSSSVSVGVLHLIKRIREFSPLITFNVLFDLYRKLKNDFHQVSDLGFREKSMKLWPTFLDAADTFLAPFTADIVEFLLEQLEATLKPSTFEEKVHYAKNLKQMISIHVLAMESLQILVSKKFEIPDIQKVVDHLIHELRLDSDILSQTALDTLRIVFRSTPPGKVNIVAVEKKLYDIVSRTKTHSTLYSVLRVMGTIGPIEPISFHLQENTGTGEWLALYDPSKREECYLRFVMNFILKSLNEENTDYSILLNAVLYIFQFDAENSPVFLDKLIPILSNLLEKSQKGAQAGAFSGDGQQYVPCDSIFYLLRSIILVVGMEIERFARVIINMINPFMQVNECNAAAAETLSVLVFVLKNSFLEFSVETFSNVLTLLNAQKKWGSDIDICLLQILTHLVIFCNGSQRLYFREIKEKATQKSITAAYAIGLLGQTIYYKAEEPFLLPSVRLALSLVEEGDASRVSIESKKLLSLLAKRVPAFVPKEFDTPAEPYEVTPGFTALRQPPAIRPVKVSTFLANFSFESWDTWLRQFSQSLVLCSSSPAIRSCHPLIQAFPSFAGRVFPLILLSVWDEASPEERAGLSQILLSVANKDVPVDVISVIADAIDIMDRAGYDLFVPEVAGDIAYRWQHYFRCVRFYERAPVVTNDIRCKAMRVHTALRRTEAAIGIFNVSKELLRDQRDLLEQLSLWGEARKFYNPEHAENDLIGFVNCSARIGDWKAVEKYFDRFDHLSLESKRIAAPNFALSAHFLGANLDHFLEHMAKDRPFNCLLQAVIAYDKKQFKSARQWVQRGMKINASDVTLTNFLSGNYEPTMSSIDYATFFEEMSDVIDVAENLIDKQTVVNIWNSKRNWIKTDTTQLLTLFLVRELLHPMLMDLLDITRKLGAWNMYENAIAMAREIRKTEDEEEQIDLIQAKVRFDRHQQRDLSEFHRIIAKTKNPTIRADAVCSLCRRCDNPDQDLMTKAREVIDTNPSFTRALKSYAYVCLRLYYQTNRVDHAYQAMHSFGELLKIDGPSLPYLCQMCSICFGPRGPETVALFRGISPHCVEKILDQLIEQFENPNDEVRNGVIEMVNSFSKDHLHALAFPIAYVSRCESLGPNISEFINSVQKQSPSFYNEIMTLTSGLLEIAFPPMEQAAFFLEKALETSDYSLFTKNCTKARELLRIEQGDTPKMSSYNTRFDRIETLPKDPEHDCKRTDMVIHIIKQIKADLGKPVRIPAVLSERKTPFSITVPGLSNMDGKAETIASFSSRVEEIPVKNHPRKITIVGSNGCQYPHILRGQVNLKLDQRVMQWLSLVNLTIRSDNIGVEKNLHVGRYPVVLLAEYAGMVGFPNGGETLGEIIEWMRERVRENVPNVVNEFCTSIQRLEQFREFVAMTRDDLLREAIWLKSASADVWFTQKTNFAISSALNSVVGYTIGLGNRNPYNIIHIGKNGNSVHLDFSESFDVAHNRVIRPETVPFRLTRMMVRVLGIAGPEGVFMSTAKFTMNILSRNKFSLVALLDVFGNDCRVDAVKERLSDDEGRTRLSQSVDQLVQQLVQAARDEYNLCQMPLEWAPQW